MKQANVTTGYMFTWITVSNISHTYQLHTYSNEETLDISAICVCHFQPATMKVRYLLANQVGIFQCLPCRTYNSPMPQSTLLLLLHGQHGDRLLTRHTFALHSLRCAQDESAMERCDNGCTHRARLISHLLFAIKRSHVF